MARVKLPEKVKPLLLIILSLTIAVLFTYSITLGAGEAGEQETTNLIYFFSILAVVSSVVILALYYTRKLWSGDNKYGDGFGFFNIGKSGALKGLKKFSALQLTMLSIIGFGFIFLFANLTKSLTGLRTLPQQFTPGQSLAFSSLLVPMSEELFSLAITGILVLLLVIFAKSQNWDKKTFYSVYFSVIPILMGLIAIIWHKTVYSSSDVALTTVFFFWFIKQIIILGIGLYLVGWALHLTNNFFIDAVRLYSSDTVFGIMVTALITLTLIYIFLYRKNKAWYKGVNR